MGTKLKFGLLLPHFCEHASAANCLEGAQRAELLRLVEDGRDRAADAGSGGGQGWLRFVRAARRINDGLYQSTLMRLPCQALERGPRARGCRDASAPATRPVSSCHVRVPRVLRANWATMADGLGRSMPFMANSGGD